MITGVAAKVYPHIERHRAAYQGKRQLAPLPDRPSIQALVEAAFWASLRREEGYVPKISIAYLKPDQADSMCFENALPLTSHSLTKLAPAVERPGIHLGAWRKDGEIQVWGVTRTLPPFSFVLEVIAPGLLVIKHSREEDSAKFINVAVLEADQVKVLDEDATRASDCPKLLEQLLGFDSPSARSNDVKLLIRLAISMRAHGRGGSLLVVPSACEIWRESIMRPIPYGVSPQFSGLASLMRAGTAERARHRWHEAVSRGVEMIAGLTAVDGATVITEDFELLAFGAKIGRRDGCDRVERVIATEPIEGAQSSVVHASQLGGTRHLSAAQFAHDQRDAMALVASQDGRFTVFAWSDCAEMVHAHGVEALLL